MSPDHISLVLSHRSVCERCSTDPFCPTNSSAFWILCGVFPPGLSVFNATVSLQSLKVLGFNASVTVFFHRDDCRLPGSLCAVCTCVHLCHFWKRPCVLSAPALGLRKPPGSVSPAAGPHTPESCFGWKRCVFFQPS